MRTATARAAASFPPEPLSVRAARRFLRTFLAEHDEDGGLVDAAQLALSEVATNAVLHAHTPFEVTAALGADGVLRVEVADAEPQLPVQRGYTGQATTGRGMELVAAYTAACGVTSRGPAGKTVWFVVVPDADPEQQPAHAWGVDQGAAASSAAGDHLVVLRGLPPTLWLAAREHHDAVLRELALWAADHPDAAPPPERRALADQARARISSRVVAELERLTAAGPHHALPPDHPSPLPDTPGTLDLALRVGADAANAFGALQDVLDAAESLAVAGRLLARPGLPEVVAVRDWACESVIAQLAGVAPSPWPGTGQERFTTEVHDRAAPPLPDWDARLVSEAARGAVAGDDANRIIAVSAPLAAALGWEVADLLGRRVVVLIPPRLREAHVAGFTRHLTTGQTHALGVPLRLPVLRADGTEVECGFLIEQTPTTTGRAVYVAWIDLPG